jgi:hypothetical protein
MKRILLLFFVISLYFSISSIKLFAQNDKSKMYNTKVDKDTIKNSGSKFGHEVIYKENQSRKDVSNQKSSKKDIYTHLAEKQVDNDSDGISDVDEKYLLEKFRPYFKFSKDDVDLSLTEEHYNPADPVWYITKSELLKSGDEDDDNPIISNAMLSQDPSKVLFKDGMYGSSDITQNASQTNYHINPMEKFSDSRGNNLGRHGATWDENRSALNIGLFGHVVPLKLSDPFKFNLYSEVTGTDAGSDYYKIEYWQFFGYNNANKSFSLGDHEGDWTTVQLIVKEGSENIISIFHYAHGKEMRFDYDNDVQSFEFTDPNNVPFLESRGCRYNINYFDLHDDERDKDSAQYNNLVRLYKGEDGLYTHPAVYIEYGGHEFWPSEYWGFYAAPKHSGDSENFYLTKTPPNLGEVEHPLFEYTSSEIILKYNGLWGTFSKSLPGFFTTGPPPGPTIHRQWTWPASSSIRWQLQGLTN